jgi:hypothetical protein
MPVYHAGWDTAGRVHDTNERIKKGLVLIGRLRENGLCQLGLLVRAAGFRDEWAVPAGPWEGRT